MKYFILLTLFVLNLHATVTDFDHNATGTGGGGGGAVNSVFGRTGAVIQSVVAPFDYSGSILTNAPYTQIDGSGNIIAVNIQAAINELAEEKVDISGTLAAGTLAPETLNRIIIKDPDSAELITVQASATTAANYTLTLPVDDGLTGQYLTTDGLGVTSWTTASRILDADGDTSVHTETAADEDKIRFTTATAERMIVDETGKVGIGTSTPAGIFDVSSTTSGALIPRMTEEQRDLITVGATTDGMVVFVTTANAGADTVDRFSWYDHDALAWKYLVSKAYVDGADVGAGALTVYSTSVVGGEVVIDQTTVFNFVDRSQGGISINQQVSIPAGTVIVPAGTVGNNLTRYVSLKYTPGTGNVTTDVSRVLYTNPNSINLGKEILVTGPFTDGTGTITGTVQFQQYATNHAGIYTAYLDGAQRARFISGGALSLSDPDAGVTNLLEFSVGAGVTYNSLMRDVEEESAWSAKDSTTSTSYKYRANSDAFTAVAPPSIAIIPNEYFDGAAVATCANNNFTVHGILAFPGSASNQFIGTHLGNGCYANLVDAENEVFSGKALEGRSEGSLSAVLVGYVILKSNIANDFSTTVQNTDWKVIGPQDVVSLTIASGSAANLGSLSDVDVATTPLIPGHLISYNGTTWVNNEYPRNMDTVTRDAMVSPAKGMLIFNTDTQAIEYKDQDGWVRLPSDYLDDTAFVSYLKAGVTAGDSTVSMATDGDHFQTAECNPSLIGRTVDYGRWNGTAWTSSSSTITAINAATIGQCDLTVDPVTTITGSSAFLATDTTLQNATTVGGTTIDIAYGTGFTATECTAGASMSAIFVHSATASERVAVTPPGTDNTTHCTYTLDGGTTMANAFAAGTKAWPTVIVTGDYLVTIPAPVVSGGGGGNEIVDADGDTKITVENAADEDTIRVFAGNAGTAIEKFWMNRFVANLLTENGLLINPREDDGTPASSTSIPLDVYRYKGSSTGAVMDVAQFRANVDVGVTPAAGDGGSINFSGHGNTTTSINLGEIDWYSTVASDSVNTVGRLEFNVKSNQEADPRPVVQLNPANLTVVGLLDSLSTTGVTPASLTLNDNDNTNSISIAAPAAVTTTQTITLPAAAPTGTGQVLSVATTAAGTTQLQWAASAGGAVFNPATTYIMDSGEGQYFDILYNGNYWFVGGQMASDTTHQVLLGGIDGDSAATLEGDIQVEPLFSNTAGVDTNAIDINRVATISKIFNTGNYQFIIDGTGRLISYGGKSNSSASTILGNCSTTATEGAIGYVVGGDVTCNTDGNGNTVPSTGWKDFAISNTYDRPLYASICAIDSADALWCWGDNASGQLGDGTVTKRLIPTKILQYDTDGAGTLGTMPTIAKVIGMKDSGTVNDGRNMAVITTTGIPLVTGDGTWGNNGDGATSNNNRFTVLSGDLAPAALGTAGATVVDMVHHGGYAGGYCAIRQITATSKRELYCWGYNNTGQVGNGSTANQTTPFKIDFDTITGSPDSTVLSVDATEGYWGSTTTCAIVGTTLAATTGSLYCWGSNTHGQVGDNSFTNRTSPTAVVMAAGDTNSDFGKIWAGDTHGNEGAYYNTSVMCATKTSPTFRTYCWGYNPTAGGAIYNAGQAENGLQLYLSTDKVIRPFMIPSLLGKNIIDLKCKPWGNEMTCLAIDSVGDIYCAAGTTSGNTACPGADVATSIGQTFFKSTGKQLYLK